MPAIEEPYHYLQKKVSSIIDELARELSQNISEFKSIAKQAYDTEEKILQSRSSYIRASREIEEEEKKQKEIESILDYFDQEIEKMRETLSTLPEEGSTPPPGSYGVMGDIDNLVSEFNSLISAIDATLPNSISLLLNENINLVKYAETLIESLTETRITKAAETQN